MLLLIDNYDSFTYNLVQYFSELDQDVRVYRNDECPIEELTKLAPQHIVISPGPCTPNKAGISLEVIKTFQQTVPILGVCLGHQSIGQAFGCKIIHAKKVMHGKTSKIYHNKKDIFQNINMPFTATRYHSLVIDVENLPDCLELSAWTTDAQGQIDEIMGIRHKELPIFGVQFHPESILSQYGHLLLQNFLSYTKQ